MKLDRTKKPIDYLRLSCHFAGDKTARNTVTAGKYRRGSQEANMSDDFSIIHDRALDSVSVLMECKTKESKWNNAD